MDASDLTPASCIGSGPLPQQQQLQQHARSASVNAIRGTGPQQAKIQSQGPHSRHSSQPVMTPLAVSEMDPSGNQYFHPTLNHVHSQTSQGYGSHHSDGGSTSRGRHSVDSGIRFYESRHHNPPSATTGNSTGGGGGGFTPVIQHTMISNDGSGSGSSGVGSAHDTRSFGAWSAPGGRSGGGVGSEGGGGGGISTAAEMDQRGSFRSEPASGDDGEVPAFTTPSFGQSNRRRSTGGGGGPVVIVGGIRGDDGGGFHGRGGSDLGSAGSPQYGSKRGSGLLGGDIWTAFPPQDLTLSPQARSDHNEVGLSHSPEFSKLY